MGSPEPSSSRRRIGAVVAAVLAVTAVVAGAASLAGSASDPTPSAAVPAAPAPEPVVDLDRGPVSEADVEACSSGGFAGSGEVEVLYGVRQRSADGDAPVLLLRNDAGELRLCDVDGPDSPAQLPLPEASTSEPVAFLGTGRRSWTCDGTTVQRYSAATWLAVAPEVRTVQERFWQNGQAGPWFTTAAQGGYAHLQTWLDGPLAEGTRLAVQTRALDADGRPVARSGLAPGRQPLAGCTGSDVQIG